MTSLEHKLKKKMLLTAIDLILKDADKSPVRCCRNLIELAKRSYPDKLTEKQWMKLKKELIKLCKNHDIAALKESFLFIFGSYD